MTERMGPNFVGRVNPLLVCSVPIGGTILKNLSTQNLMELLGDATPVEDDPVSKWLKSEGYYPGQSRILSRTLYQRFQTWLRQHPEIVTEKMTHTAFGQQMRRRFKWGRSAKGNVYYVSRDESCEVGELGS